MTLPSQARRSEPTPDALERVEVVRRIAREVAGPAAASVDKDARFPSETFAALKKERMLSACVPVELGGFGSSMAELGLMCEALGQRCAASAMIFAMHQIQLACIARHFGTSAFFKQYLKDVATEQRLIASVTTEAGVGGSMRTSVSGIVREGASCKLRKDGSVVSYGEAADDLLITIKRSPEAPASDQVLVLAKKSQVTMEKTSEWDSFGMRGTCSPGFIVTATFPEEQLVPEPFGTISSRTMVPYAHILWGSTWLGIATDAVARARAFVRGQAQKTPTVTPPAATRLSEVSTQLQTMRSHVRDFARRFDELSSTPDGGAAELSSIAYALQINHLKISASRMVVDIATDALRICGIAGYKNDSPFSVTRHLRDAHSAALMISNERIHAGNAPMHLHYKDEAL